MSYLTRALGAAQLLLKANAPTIMVTSGVVAMGAGTVVACKKTLRIEEVLEPHVVMLERVQEGETLELEGYPAEYARSDRIKIYSRVGLDLGKLYFVPGTLFIAGAGLVFAGHRVLVKRNATLALAYTGLKAAFDKYRQNVVDQWGSEADQAMYGGHRMKEVTDPETGASALVPERDWDETHDMYNRVFEQGASTQWENDLGVNKMFIAHQMKFAQDKLNASGILYLCEVYKALGFPETDVSRVVGWKVKKLPDGSRDIPMVDFGLDKPHSDDFKYNKENAIYLDFNCQGLIVGGKVQKILERS